jgi:hypothetical protein
MPSAVNSISKPGPLLKGTVGDHADCAGAQARANLARHRNLLADLGKKRCDSIAVTSLRRNLRGAPRMIPHESPA